MVLGVGLVQAEEQKPPAGSDFVRIDFVSEKDGVVKMVGHTLRIVDGKEQPVERVGVSCLLKARGCGLPKIDIIYLMAAEGGHTTYQQPEYILLAPAPESTRYVVALGLRTKY